MNKKIVLHIEDNPADIKLMQRIFEINDSHTQIISFKDGQQALDFLYKKTKQTTQQEFCPDLILIDINMPKISGKEIIAILKSDSKFKPIPIIVLTTSNSASDIKECYELGANMYFTKPSRLEDYSKLLKKIDEIWFTFAELPPKNS